MKAPKLNLYCFYTENFEPLVIRFLSGIEDEVDLYCYDLSAEHVGGLGGGRKVWQFKTELLIKASAPVPNAEQAITLFADIDIAVYRPMTESLQCALQGHDIVFQRERGLGDEQANIGVIAFRRSHKVSCFWNDVLKAVNATGKWDQAVVNDFICDSNYLAAIDLKPGYLPSSFWARSQSQSIPVDDCILHHANCVGDIAGKWQQLNSWRNLFEASRRNNVEWFHIFVSRLTQIEWTFGELSQAVAYGKMRFDDHFFVQGYDNPNEHRLVIRDDSFVMLTSDNHISCVFDEFYFDKRREKLFAVGVAFPERWNSQDEKIIFHYLLGQI